MANIVSDVLSDGTIRVFDLDVCQSHAENVIEELWQKEGEVINYDFYSTVFALFAETVHLLTSTGWTTEDLIATVIDHSDADDVVDFIDDHNLDGDED